MKTWEIDFFRDRDGNEPAREWLDGLSEDVRGKVLARINLLREQGPSLDYPFTAQIEGRLRELRFRVGKSRYRMLYFFDQNRTAVLLHGFTKHTAAVEESDKRIGNSRMRIHEQGLAERKGFTRLGRKPAK